MRYLLLLLLVPLVAAADTPIEAMEKGIIGKWTVLKKESIVASKVTPSNDDQRYNNLMTEVDHIIEFSPDGTATTTKYAYSFKWLVMENALHEVHVTLVRAHEDGISTLLYKATTKDGRVFLETRNNYIHRDYTLILGK